MKVLFWNTHQNPEINSALCELIIDYKITTVVLAEYSANLNNLIDILKTHDILMTECTFNCKRIVVLSTLQAMEPRIDEDHYTIQVIDKKDILCCVHLNSKIYAKNESIRELDIEHIMNDIRNLEYEIHTENSIIVGDLNMNPYESACVDARFFHSIPIYEEAKRKSRSILRKKYFMFYNPMWNFLGDFHFPYGTYYFNTGDTYNTYWNIFDQVLIRPALRERFNEGNLKVITETSMRSLRDHNGHPNVKISDHLPIAFEVRKE